MIDAADALSLSDTVLGGGIPVMPPTTTRQGNKLLDDANTAVVFAAMKGLKEAYVTIQGSPQTAVNNFVDKLEILGYTVSRDRERSYYEIFMNWES